MLQVLMRKPPKQTKKENNLIKRLALSRDR